MIGNPNKETVARSAYLSTETRSPVQFGREICSSVYEASEREWLVTNGIGGFASGTISGLLTRRYRGVLIAALKPPLGRTLLVTKLEDGARYADQRIAEYFQVRLDEWSQKPTPDRLLVIDTIALPCAATVHAAIISMLGRDAPQPTRTAEAASFSPIANHINTHGLGTASEIFDGDAPFNLRGCIAQARTVGELIRGWAALACAGRNSGFECTVQIGKESRRIAQGGISRGN
jgi:hypothetical protein